MSKLFQKANRKQVRLRMALDGPSGAGKTFTALRFAFGLLDPTKPGGVAVVNTESGAIEKYLGLSPDGIPFDFDICTLNDYSPSTYTSAIQAAGREMYQVLIVDSLSHAWEGEGGALDQVDRKGGNRFTAWKDVTPQHRAMVEAILRSPCHTIVTMRSKTEYVLETDERGKQIPRRIGLKPIQRDGMEYEFDIVADLDHTHLLTVSKSRCPEVDGAKVLKPGAVFLTPVVNWLRDGSAVDASFFAVTEDDLKALQKPPTGGQAGERHVDAKEQMREQAKQRQQATKKTVGTPTENAVENPVETANEPIPTEPLATENQVIHIKELFSQLGTPPEKQAEILAKRSATSVEQLTESAAHELIDKLMEIYGSKVDQELKEAKELVPF